VRVKALAKAIKHFEHSVDYDKANPQYLYTYALGLDGLSKTQQGMTLLKENMSAYTEQDQLKELGLYFAQKLQDRAAYELFNR